MIDEFEEMAVEIDDEIDEVVKDDYQAESAINHIRAIEADYDRLIKVCEQQIARYQDKIKAYEEQKKDKTAFYYWRLKDFFASRDGKRELKTKSVYTLPSGTITLVYGKQKVEHKDKELLEWLKTNGYDEYIKKKEAEVVDWENLKEKLAFVDGNAIMGDDGSVVDGVTAINVPDRIDFKLTE